MASVSGVMNVDWTQEACCAAFPSFSTESFTSVRNAPTSDAPAVAESRDGWPPQATDAAIRVNVVRADSARMAASLGQQRSLRIDETFVQGAHRLGRAVAWNHPGDPERGRGRAWRDDA